MIAPHGGARHHAEHPEVPRRGARQRRINDLHTAALAVELADRLGGSYVVNCGLDRNRLDLNRISQVHRRAPWFLQLVARLAAAIADRHGDVQVLVVHGWNIGQGRCDLGVGADLSTSSDTANCLSELTVSPEFLRRRLRPLTAAAAGNPAQRFTLGERYPARHRNNLLQLFRRDGSRSDELPDRLAALVRAGRCQAVQLELGAPLRWPGPRRERFVARLVEAFGDAAAASATAPSQSTVASPPARAGRAPRRSHGVTAQALQVFDPRSRVAVLASVDRLVEPGPVFGRVALFLPDGRVGLYTGESASAAGLVGDGPGFTTRDGGSELSFTGAFLVTGNGADYVDLERALLFSDLVDAEISLAYAPRSGGATGTVTGVVRLGDTAYPIDATGFSKAREWGAWRRAARAHWSIRAAFTDGAAALYQSAARSGATRVDCARLLLGDDPYAPEELTLAVAARTLQVRPLSRMSIARPVGPTRRARVTFGPAAIHEAGRTTGFAIYEYARLIDR